jgi:hypothetical protein
MWRNGSVSNAIGWFEGSAAQADNKIIATIKGGINKKGLANLLMR